MVSADWENVCRRSQSWCATVHAVPPDHTVPCRSSSLDVRCRARIRSPRTSSRARTRSRAASCATVGTTTGVISSRRSNRARCWASLASVLTRSPDGRCSFDGAATTHRMLWSVRTGPARSRSVRPRTPPRPGRAAPAASPAPPRAADPAGPGTSRLCWHRYRRPPPTLRARPDRRSYALAAPGPPATVGTTDQVHPRRQPTTTCERGPGPRVRAPPYRLRRSYAEWVLRTVIQGAEDFRISGENVKIPPHPAEGTDMRIRTPLLAAAAAAMLAGAALPASAAPVDTVTTFTLT